MLPDMRITDQKKSKNRSSIKEREKEKRKEKRIPIFFNPNFMGVLLYPLIDEREKTEKKGHPFSQSRYLWASFFSPWVSFFLLPFFSFSSPFFPLLIYGCPIFLSYFFLYFFPFFIFLFFPTIFSENR